MKFTKLALTLACSCVLFCGCVNNSQGVLKINDTIITKKEFESDFNKIRALQFKNAPKEISKDGSYAVLVLKDRYTNDLITRTLLTQEFTKRNIEATKEEVEAKKAQIISQIGSEEQLNTILKQNGISKDRFEKDMQSEVKLSKLALSLTKEASDSDVQKYYKSHKAEFATPKRVQVSHILIQANPEEIRRQITDADKKGKLSQTEIDAKVREEMANKEKEAKEIQQKAAKNPKDFATLATKFSQDEGSAKKGGDLGYIIEGQMVPEFEKAAFGLKVGTVSNLVKTQYGYHILIVRDKAAKGTKSLEEVKADLKEYLTELNKKEAIKKLAEGLKATATIEYLDENLKPEVIKQQILDSLPKQEELLQKDGAPKAKEKTIEEVNKK